jgi:hypothetical protein
MMTLTQFFFNREAIDDLHTQDKEFRVFFLHRYFISFANSDSLFVMCLHQVSQVEWSLKWCSTGLLQEASNSS